jgi:hypothetical protein
MTTTNVGEHVTCHANARAASVTARPQPPCNVGVVRRVLEIRHALQQLAHSQPRYSVEQGQTSKQPCAECAFFKARLRDAMNTHFIRRQWQTG